MVDAVLSDLESSPLDEKHKTLFRFGEKVNHRSPQISADDMDGLRTIGWTDEAIYFAITVCAVQLLHRWVDAAGVHAMSDEAHRQGAKRMAREGYVR